MPHRLRPTAMTSFVDGVQRAVYQEPDGRQFVLDGVEKVYGVWVLPDEPTEVFEKC
jgi:hypothetical protein